MTFCLLSCWAPPLALYGSLRMFHTFLRQAGAGAAFPRRIPLGFVTETPWNSRKEPPECQRQWLLLTMDSRAVAHYGFSGCGSLWILADIQAQWSHAVPLVLQSDAKG